MGGMDDCKMNGVGNTVIFEAVPIGAAFRFHGRRYVKIAKSMTESDDRVGHIFQAGTVVEPEGGSASAPPILRGEIGLNP